MNTTGVYIHVPFCASKCGYCNFYSAPASGEVMAAYAQKAAQAAMTAPFEYGGADTVYFGGGTPSLLEPKQLLACLKAIDRRYPLTADCEVTMEANPTSLTLPKLKELRTGGVNRLSIGVQSLEDSRLKLLGRRHNAEQACEAVRLAQQAGFENISVDLMLGLPEQTAEHIEHFGRCFAELGVSHISAYLLKIEEGTPFARLNMQERCPDEDTAADLYLETVKLLDSLGFRQYEISNFAKNGQISRHNTRYWKCRDYLGIGPAAHSFIKGGRFYFEGDTQAFLSAENVWELLRSDGEGGDWEEYCMLALRLTEGLDLAEGRALYPTAEWDTLLRRSVLYQKNGYMTLDNNRLAFTPKGFLVSNDILAALLL